MHQLPNLKALATLQVMFMMCEQCTGSYTTQPLINPNNHINLTQCYDAAENSNGTIAYSTSDMPCFHVGRPSSEASIGKSWKSRGQPGPHGTLRGCSRGPIRARCGVGVHDLDCWYTGILILSLIKVVCQMWVEDQTIKKNKEVKLLFILSFPLHSKDNSFHLFYKFRQAFFHSTAWQHVHWFAFTVSPMPGGRSGEQRLLGSCDSWQQRL